MSELLSLQLLDEQNVESTNERGSWMSMWCSGDNSGISVACGPTK